MNALFRWTLAGAVLVAAQVLAEDVFVRRFGEAEPVLVRDVDPEKLVVERWEAWCFRQRDGKRSRWGIISAPTLARLNKEIADAHRLDDEWERWTGRRAVLNYDDLQAPIAVLKMPQKPPRRATVREALEQARRDLAEKVRDLVRNAKSDFDRSAVGQALQELKQLEDTVTRLDKVFSAGPASERTYRDVTTGLDGFRSRLGTVAPAASGSGATPTLPPPQDTGGGACCVPELTWAQCPDGQTLVDCLGFDARTLPLGCEPQGEDRYCCPGTLSGPRCP